MIAMRQPYQNDLETRDGASLQLDRIVVGIDFTEPSLAVARWVGRNLARTAELTLVHVTPMRLIPNVSRIRSNPLVAPDSRSGDRLRSLHGALRGLASMIGGTRAAVEVRVGDPATQLAAYANLVDPDLVVVGGSTAYHVAPRHETATTERLLRRISRPVLIARSVHAAPTTVLAAVADDVGTSPVLAAARMLARPCAARVATLPVTRRRSAACGDHCRRYSHACWRDHARRQRHRRAQARADRKLLGARRT